MRWRHGRRSSNVEDRRGQGVGHARGGAGASLLRFIPALVRSKTGRGLLVIGVVVVIGARFMGVDLLPLLTGAGAGPVRSQPYQASPEEAELAEFVSVVLADTEDTWQALFSARGQSYREPTLVLFSGRVHSACGMASAAVGPFYCGADEKLYIDLSFFADLARRHDAPGDFAQAYVVAHEVGHHVQNLMGISGRVRAARHGRDASESNALSVRQELQADCFAGLWGHAANSERQLLDPGDLEEALTAAAAIGDDRLQREAGRNVVPDSFTHGSSAQRAQWFRTGFTTGEITACDTFQGT